MKRINRILLFILFLSASYTFSYAQENQTYFLHTIEKGQSLYSIAQMYNVTTHDIVRLNPGCDEKIYAGQTIKIPQGKESQKGETFHTIQAGETLYKLTTRYNVSAKRICEVNPGLSAENFRIGQVILIPQEKEQEETKAVEKTEPQTVIPGPVKSRCKEMHRVKRKETIFSVSREYNISEKELINANPELRKGMKKGQLLCIPYPEKEPESATPKEDPYAIPPTNNELFTKSKVSPREIQTIKAALILPFQEDKRMVEYYEGFLMAVDSLKRLGTSVDLYVYDSGKEATSLNVLLKKEEMKTMNVIFGPMHQELIKPLAKFAEQNNSRLVIPFSSKGKEVFNNPSIYQINTPQSYLYSEVYEHFTRQFPAAHVIFIEPTVPDKDKAEFISGLKHELKKNGISMATVSENATKDQLKEVLHTDKENVFIPTTGKNVMLIKVLPQLTLLVRDTPQQNIHLFGYPEWQTYTRDHLESFFELDTYFYSSFYTNTLFPAAVQFTNAYHKWYGKDLSSKYPSYSMLGFDTGFFFLKGLNRFGTELENNLPRISLTPIQTGFKFERVNNWGGFINKKIFFIRFTRNFELVKLDFE